MKLRRLLLGAVIALIAVGGASALVLRGGGGTRAAKACPPGFTTAAQRESARAREQRVEHAREQALATGGVRAGEPTAGEGEREGEGCQPLKHPESFADVARISANQTARAAAPATRVRSGAYANAVAEARSVARRPRATPGADGQWTPAGTTPLIDDEPGYDSVNGQGLADLAGRITDYTLDGTDLYASVGEGGVWKSTDSGDSWHDVGKTLPTQAVGSVAVVDRSGGKRLLALTGDDVFGGGTTYSGVGVWSSDDDGATWSHSTGVPDAALGFRLKVVPGTDDVYAATGKGLYRSTDGGLTFSRVTLPTGCEDLADPKCFLANMVTDVAVKVPGGVPSATPSTVKVVAAVGWRAGNKESVDGDHVEAPGNGVYTSDDGTTFTKVPTNTATGFAAGQPDADGGVQGKIGRIEMGVASGPGQDHDYLYAVVQDPSGFKNGQVGSIDVPDESPSKGVTTTYLRGIYVSPDFGKTWKLLSNATALQPPTTGSALSVTACAASQYCPGVQAWYNQWIEPDPGATASVTHAPKRLTFGLEEVWENEQTPANDLAGADGSTPLGFKVVGRYFGGTTCQFLSTGLPACPTNRPPQNSTTTHPDQHSAIYAPVNGKSRLLVGNDGGSYHQDVAPADDVDNAKWGRGFQAGFNTLIAYGANVAKDGTIYSGLQDNGEMRINPDGKQVGIYGGDGGISAVDPDHSDTAYEEYTNGDMRATTDGGKTWNDITPPTDTYMFTNPFTMDAADANHLITAGTKVYETTKGPGTTSGDWKQVFDLGTTGAVANQMSAIDVRGVRIPGTQGLPTGPHTANFNYTAGGSTVPGPGSSSGAYVPGTYDDHPFTIAKDDGDAAVDVEVTWADPNSDWDLEIFRKEADGSLTQVGQSANGNTTKERVSIPNPPPGDYVIRVENFAATGTFDTAVTFDQRAADAPKNQNAAYVAYCAYCDVLNTRPFSNGIATNVLGDKPGVAGSPDGWHKVAAHGLPRRYVTSIKADPADPTTVYAAVAGYSRRWLPVGALGEGVTGADVGSGHVFKSTDGGQNFTDISGNLPDAPAEWTIVRQDQLIVGTDVGVYVSDVNGGTWELLGRGLPNAPTYSLDLQQKGAADTADVLVAATQGRGIYKLPLPPVGATTRSTPQSFFGPAATSAVSPTTARRKPATCSRDDGIGTASARGSGRALRLAFTRRKALPLTVDVFQASRGTTILDNRRVALFTKKSRSFTWNGTANRRGKRVVDGIYFVRYTMKVKGRNDTRRVAVERRKGRWSVLPAFDTHDQCAVLADAKSERPVYGGTRSRALLTSFRVGPDPAVVSVAVMRGRRTLRKVRPKAVAAGRLYRLSFSAKTLKRGTYRFVVTGDAAGRKVTRTVTARRL